MKDYRGSPICERVYQKIEYFKNNTLQCKIAKALQISLSAVHKSSKDSEKLEKMAVKITLDPSHPALSLFELLPSG